MLAVPVLAAVTHLGLIFEDDYLIVPAVAVNFSQHPGAFDDRPADGYIIAIADEQYPVQLDGTAFFGLQALYLDGITLGDPVLFTTCFNNSVNFKPPKLTLYQFHGWASTWLGAFQQPLPLRSYSCLQLIKRTVGINNDIRLLHAFFMRHLRAYPRFRFRLCVSFLFCQSL
jgi:hypothetical protein